MTVNGSASTSVVIGGCTERNGFDSCSNMVIHCPSTSRKLQNGSCSIEGVDGISTVPTVHAVTVHTEDAFHDLTIGGVVVEDSYIHCGNDNDQFSCKLNERSIERSVNLHGDRLCIHCVLFQDGSVKKVRYLCIAGGLAQSKYFQHRIHEAFGVDSDYGLSIRIPRRPILSVIDGVYCAMFFSVCHGVVC